MPLKFGLLSLAIAVLFIGAPAMAVEEPKFRTIVEDGAFEVRDYPSLTVAEVMVTGDQSTAASRGFRLLAGYIFGANHGGEKIAMTAPVGLARTGDKIPITAPVGQTRMGMSWIVRFTMPSSYRLATLPAPNDARIRLSVQPPARLAVLRFSGWATESKVETETTDLLERVKVSHLRVIGPVTLAQYDPPWTLPFLRRNELMVPIGR